MLYPLLRCLNAEPLKSSCFRSAFSQDKRTESEYLADTSRTALSRFVSLLFATVARETRSLATRQSSANSLRRLAALFARIGDVSQTIFYSPHFNYEGRKVTTLRAVYQ